MESTSHLPILKRAGAVLLVVGLIDVAVMIYCIINSVSYSSSFNILAVAAGIFLLRGNLRAASIIRWIAVFMFSAFSGLLLVWPFMQPIDLTLTQAPPKSACIRRFAGPDGVRARFVALAISRTGTGSNSGSTGRCWTEGS